MDKSTIDQFLYVVFGPSTQQVFHGWPILPFTFDWSDDIDEQARIIRKLANIATPKGGEVFGYEAQTWAYDKLREIVRDYREHSTLGSVPPEMIAWCFDVASGAIEPLKRRRGRVPAHQHGPQQGDHSCLRVASRYWPHKGIRNGDDCEGRRTGQE